jgi:hypothetical protein
MTDNMSEPCQSLIICLHHTNDWWYVWIIPMIDNMSESSDILSVIGMIQTYHQLLVWFKHIMSQWYDSGILSVIGMIQVYHQLYTNDRWYVCIIQMTDSIPEWCQSLIICLNHTNDWRYVWIIPMTDTMPESYQWLIVCIIQVYYQSLECFRHNISHWYDSDILSVIGMIQTYHQSLVWCRHTISHWYDSGIVSVIGQ